MLTNLLLPWLSWLHLNEIAISDERIIFVLQSTQNEPPCPVCRHPGAAVHSHYARRIADLPCAGMGVRLQIHVRKFFCRNPGCRRSVFCERLLDLAVAYARCTQRLQDEQRQLGLDFGGEAAARTACRQGMPASGDTLLRLVRRMPPEEPVTPRVLGVDDWALRKGHSYGTILVDLERHQPVDLLSDRSADTLARWLQEHPGVESISRDRANDYIEGASRGAPDAIQVADRFHLLQNVREMLQRLLERHQAALRAAITEDELIEQPDAVSAAGSSTVEDGDAQISFPSETATDLTQAQPPPAVTVLTKAESQKQARQAVQRSRYETVRTLHGNGLSQRQIARQLKMSVHTVRSYLRTDQFPQRATRQVSSKLTPFLPYLRQQLEAGQDNATQLWRDLRDQFGYTGSRPLVSRWVARHRHLCPQPSVHQSRPKRPGRPPGSPRPQPHPVRHLSARQAAWLLVRRPEKLDEEEGSLVERLCQHAAEVQVTYTLAQEFIQMVQQRSVVFFEEWLIQVKASGVPELQSFAAGLQRDKQAVMAALSLPYSNGQVEGQINRLKFIKRSMYGRAGSICCENGCSPHSSPQLHQNCGRARVK